MCAKRITYRLHTYDTYTADYPNEHIKMFWKDKQGLKLHNFINLNDNLKAEGQQLIFATNGGMYTPESAPVGYYVENGKQLMKLDTANKGPGNFYMQPNGVFLLTAGKAMVVSTARVNTIKEPLVYATQSGPMLITDGNINTNFVKGSANTNIRNGVGINKEGNVVFAIYNEKVNFYDFALLFKESLQCDNALYLDGAISQMYLPALKRNDTGGDYGVIIAITASR
jgi:uncharacterized protein YigE (DUF2233 family)